MSYSVEVSSDFKAEQHADLKSPDGMDDSVSLYSRFGKRVFDVMIVMLFAPIVLPLVLPVALLISFDGSNPFYRQTRIGKGGKQFRMWKFRSMVSNADAKLDAYLDAHPDAKDEWDKMQKLKNDPRITKIGRFIRKTSMDELPQLWNVLKGDMSLVGPRPMMVCQKELYLGEDYYALRPGITGLWQVSERNESSFADRAVFDSEYLRNLTAGYDFQILLRTVGVVLRATGH